MIEERWIAPRFGVVQDGSLYRSGQLPAPIAAGFLRSRGFERIVNLTGVEPGDPKQAAQAAAVAELRIDERRFSMGGDGVIPGDDDQTIAMYIGAITAMHEGRRDGAKTLVHCQAGSQRTGGVVAAYRLLVDGWPSPRAYAEALEYDWDPDEDHAWPAFLNRRMDGIAEGLVEAGVLEAVPRPLPVFAPW